MIGRDFFQRATDAGAISDASMSELLDTWGIDIEAFLGWMIVYRQAVVNYDLPMDEVVSCALVAGFETGYRARLAVEEAA
jgi:hypothetical protein